MKIPTTLPITAEQSRASRFQLGLTQANVIEESSLPGHKLKNFETGRFVPDMPFLEGLRDYYAQKGIDFTETVTVTTQVNDQIQAGQQQPPAHGGAMVRPVSRTCFYVSNQIEPGAVDQILGRMDGNDDRIAASPGARYCDYRSPAPINAPAARQNQGAGRLIDRIAR